MKEGMWYLRFFTHWQVKLDPPKVISQNVSVCTKTTQGYKEFILVAYDVLKEIKNQHRIDDVELSTGRVARHDYKKPLPEWLKDPLIRQMAAATGKVP